MARTIFVSVDVETTGPVPGPHSMVWYAAVAYADDGTEIAQFSERLCELPDARRDEGTMAWWDKNPQAWNACLVDQQDPAESMSRFDTWVRSLPGKPIACASPASFDVPFLAYYLQRFLGTNVLGHRSLDIRSYAAGATGTPYTETHIEQWMDEGLKVTHDPLDDARAQASALFRVMGIARKGRR